MAKKEKFTTRQLQAIKSKQNIYNAAMNLIKEMGVDKFTINDICHELNISVGAFYHHFKSKEDLLTTIYFSADNSFSRNMDVDENLDPFEKIISYYRWYAEYNESLGVEFCRQFYHGNNSSIASYKRKNLDYLQSVLNELLQERQPQEAIPLERLLHHLNIIARGVAFDWCISNGEYDITREMIAVVTAYLQGVLKHDSNTEER